MPEEVLLRGHYWIPRLPWWDLPGSNWRPHACQACALNQLS